jgi:16S rRNA (cytosine967-C5)-methyltransferase
LVLSRVESGQAFANVLLYHDLADAHLSPADAGLATELVYGTLRYLSRLDWTLAGAVRSPVAELPPRIRAILRAAVYQLVFLHRVPARAVVHEAVELAKRHGHAGTTALVNAVLRRIAAQGERPVPDGGDPAGRLALMESHPRWLVDRWLLRYGPDDTLALCRANNTPAPISARVNRLRAAPEAVVRDLASAGVTTRATWLPEGLWLDGPFDARHRLVASGVLTMQDLGAMVVTHLLDPQPGETIIDACAAPGGKTTHIAERIGDSGRVIACDVHPGKLEALQRRVDGMGLRCVQVVNCDARTLGEIYPQAADRVLVDAPCTGLGVVRRRPEIKWRIQPEDGAAMAVRQRAILHGAAAAVRPGGMLLYSVCSTEPEEGPMVVEQFLAQHPDFVRDPDLPLPAGLTAGDGAAGAVTLLPHRHGTDGFFIARMRRRPETESNALESGGTSWNSRA